MVDIIQHRGTKVAYQIAHLAELPSNEWVRIQSGLSHVEAIQYLQMINAGNKHVPQIVNPKRKC